MSIEAYAVSLAIEAAIKSVDYLTKTSGKISLLIKEIIGECVDSVYYIDGLRIDFDRAHKMWRAPSNQLLSELLAGSATGIQTSASEYVFYELQDHPHLKKEWVQQIAKAAIFFQALMLRAKIPQGMFHTLTRICPMRTKNQQESFSVVQDTCDAWRTLMNYSIKKNKQEFNGIVRMLVNEIKELPSGKHINFGKLP